MRLYKVVAWIRECGEFYSDFYGEDVDNGSWECRSQTITLYT